MVFLVCVWIIYLLTLDPIASHISSCFLRVVPSDHPLQWRLHFLTNRTLPSRPDSEGPSLHSLWSPGSFCFPPHTSSAARLSRYFLCMISEIYFFLSGWQADTWIRSSFLWLSWHSISLCATSSHFQSLETVVICWYHWFHLFIFHTFLQPLGSWLHPRSFVLGLETWLQSILQTLSVIFTLLSFTIQGETLSQYFITDLICSLHTTSMSVLPG